MALDRQYIEKRDFPIGRRGYEPDAVDAHLASLAGEVEALQRSSSRRSGQSLAAAASAQVQAIVEAAESSAAEIEREARDEAAQIRQDAARDAQRTRDEAIERSQEHVARVRDAASHMLQRVEAMESEVSALVETLRTGSNRLTADLSLLEGEMGDLYSASGRGADSAAPAELDPEPAPAPAAEPMAAVSPVYDPGDTIEADVLDIEGDEEEDDDLVDEAPADAGADEDIEGARLIALNMALNGQSREETDRYLADNFELGDRAALLDEVYSTVEG